LRLQIDDYTGGNITSLNHGEFLALSFSPDEVTNLWQARIRATALLDRNYQH
jgi:hypothetical protein